MNGPVTKVTEVRGAYAFEGTTYGPFQASKDTPYLEVPAQLATALGLPLHESEVQAREEAEADDADGADVEELIQANRDLKADLDELHQVIGWSSDNSVSAAELIRNIQGAAETNRGQLDRVTVELDQAHSRISDLEEQLAAATSQLSEAQAAQVTANTAALDANTTALQQADAPAAPAADQQSTPLVDGITHTELLIPAGFNSMEALEAGLVIAEGETESPVRKIDGIGAKTEEALKKAVADWRASL